MAEKRRSCSIGSNFLLLRLLLSGVLLLVLCQCQISAPRVKLQEEHVEIPEGSHTHQVLIRLDAALEAFAALRVQDGWPMAYSADLTRRWGEYNECDEWQITVQPPATPTVAGVYLRAAQITGNRQYERTAREAADILREGQLANGGWWYEIRLNERGPAEYYYLKDRGDHEKADLFCTASLDDRTSQGAIDFMMEIAAATGDRDFHQSARAGLDFLLAAQYPQGGWPQLFPPGNTGYHRYMTLNDGTSTDAILTLLRGYHQYEDQRYLDAALRAAQWLIDFQLPDPHPGWAQQFTLEGKPAPARWFEPAACCSASTAHVIKALIEVYLETGHEGYLSPIPKAVEWLKSSEIRPGVWARFYEINTNRPIYVNQERQTVYEPENLREGYAWQGAFAASAIEEYEKLMRLGRNAYVKDRKFVTQEEEDLRFLELQRQVDQVLARQRDDGLWVVDGRISCRAFVSNCRILCEYLELWKKRNAAALLRQS